jgi:hypothetical protein
MPYTDASTFQKRFKHRTVATFPGSSQFTQLISDYGAEFNRFLDVESDICSVSSATNETKFVAKVHNDILEEHLKYIEKSANETGQGTEVPPLVPPSFFDPQHVWIREAIFKEKREEKCRAANYSFRNGRVRRWY